MPTHQKVRKQFILDPAKLNAAKKALAARTDTETVDRAFDYVLGQERLWAAHERLFRHITDEDIASLDDLYPPE